MKFSVWFDFKINYFPLYNCDLIVFLVVSSYVLKWVNGLSYLEKLNSVTDLDSWIHFVRE